MALVSAALKAELVGMGLFSDEPSACAAWAAAYRKYFEGAAAGVVPVIPAALGAPEAAMLSGLTGLSTSGAAAIQTGILAFWGAMTPAASYFAASTAITPPVGLSSLSVTLTTVFASNVAGALSADACYDAIASAIHTASAGGIAVFPPPPGGIGPQTIV
jgi:hypothetical protein